MHSNELQVGNLDYSSKVQERFFGISLADCDDAVAVDYSDNPHLLLEIEEFRNVVGLKSAVQAGLLVNQDQSCWLINLGRSGTTEVYRPLNHSYRKLANNQVAYLRDGDMVGFFSAFYRVEFRDLKIVFVPVELAPNPCAN